MSKDFKNEQVHKIEIRGLTGTVTLPILMEDKDLAIYLEQTRLMYEEAKKAQEEEIEEEKIISVPESRFRRIRHLVRAIDFPNTTLSQFSGNGKRPFPALTMKIYEIAEGLIEDSLSTKNS